jgi:hypothetical protein
MGRLMRWLVAAGLAATLMALGAGTAAAFDGFGALSADSTYGSEIRFTVTLEGDAPERLELLLETPEAEGSFVVPVVPGGATVTHVLDTSTDHMNPNTPVTYTWRAADGETVTLSDTQTILYEDDRPGLDWRSAQLGEATVHWYGDAEQQARRFGELTAVGVEQGEELLGTTLAGPVDVFVYATREDFFGALGPGAREWTGAAAFSELRTIFMWLEGGSPEYLEVAMIHEVTHIVFHDATDNAFHEPARWLNEGIATWSETGDAGGERSIVEQEAAGEGLFSFDAITEQFPIGERGGRLSYAQGTTMTDLIVDRYGADAIARIASAYRDGASDDEALEAGTGTPADELYADFFAEFGVDVPTPIAADSIAPSDVDRPTPGEIDGGGVDPGAEPPPGEAIPGEGGGEPEAAGSVPLIIGIVAGVAIVGGAALFVWRRAARRAEP